MGYRQYPMYFDFTNPVMGRSFNLKKVDGLFEEKFKVVTGVIYYNIYGNNIYIRVGDILFRSMPNKRIGMFRILEINTDIDVSNVFYCKAVFCGYHEKTRQIFFEGFNDAWNKHFVETTVKKEEVPLKIKKNKSFLEKLINFVLG